VRLVDIETVRNWEFSDSCTGKAHGEEIQVFFIPDVSNWKDHNSYHEQFVRLLMDPKTEADRVDPTTGRAD